MPNRILKESICTSEDIDRMTWFQESFYYRLIVNCDDFGRFDARPAILKARLFPLKERVTLKDVSNALASLAGIGIVKLYECDGRPYLYLPAWSVHQTVRAAKSKYPDPQQMNSSEINCMQMNADAPVFVFDNRESNSIFDIRDTPAKKFTPPTVEEVAAYVKERNSRVDPQYFVDFYASKDWMVGKNKMKDWKSACRNAEHWDRWGKAPSHPKEVPTDAKKNAEWMKKLLEEK